MAKIARSSVPNVFTFANLSCGIMSLMMCFQENYLWASIFILLACLADRYDGRVARFLKVSSELGKQLDSLADLVSFGVAPSVLIFNIYNFSTFGLLGYVLVLLLPICGAYRLARYNITDFDEELETVAHVATGLTDETLAKLTKMMEKYKINEKGTKIIVKPKIILEIAYSEIVKSPEYDAGYSLRFPVVKRIRDDKGLEDIDTVERLKSMYKE